jgi:hypothetical protein
MRSQPCFPLSAWEQTLAMRRRLYGETPIIPTAASCYQVATETASGACPTPSPRLDAELELPKSEFRPGPPTRALACGAVLVALLVLVVVRWRRRT